MQYILIVIFFLTGCREHEPSKEERIGQIRSRIEVLHREIDTLEKEALRDQVEGEEAMFSNYSRFTQEWQSSEAMQDRIKVIQEELRNLELEKQHLESER